MDAEEDLDRHGVTAYLKDVVTLLLENRPDSPIAFIAHYFRTVTQGSSPLLRAYRYIRLASPEQDAFTDNLVASYSALDSRRSSCGVIGSDLMKLLRLIGADCSLDISLSLLVLLGKAESDPVAFTEFSSAVRSPSLGRPVRRRHPVPHTAAAARGSAPQPHACTVYPQVRACLQYDQFFRAAEALYTVCEQHAVCLQGATVQGARHPSTVLAAPRRCWSACGVVAVTLGSEWRFRWQGVACRRVSLRSRSGKCAAAREGGGSRRWRGMCCPRPPEALPTSARRVER